MDDSVIAPLREVLLEAFSEAELVELCRELGFEYDELPVVGKHARTRSMIRLAKDHRKLDLLIARIHRLRPSAYVESGLADAVSRSRPRALKPPRRRSVKKIIFDALQQWHVSVPKQPRAIVSPLLVFGTVVVAIVLVADLLSGEPVSEAHRIGPRPQELAKAPASAPRPIATLVPAQPQPTPQPAAPAVAQALPTATRQIVIPTPVPLAQPTVVLPTATPQIVIAIAPTQEPIGRVPAPTAAPPRAAPAATAAPPISASGNSKPEQAVRALNAQIVDFFRGSVKLDQLAQYWTPETKAAMIHFNTDLLPRTLGCSKSRPCPVEASVRYVTEPRIAYQRADTVIVTTTEYWKYTRTDNGATSCETRDYSYTLETTEAGLRVTAFSGKLKSPGCRS